jgi:hypothetical protein
VIYVNNLAAEPGCYIAGHWGQYGPDRMAEICDWFQIDLDDDDNPVYWRAAAEAETAEDAAIVRNAVGIGSHLASPEECWERHYEAADKIEQLLNDKTTGGFWTWQDGEFFLADDADREEDDQ